jgi:hypothetical protein
MNDTPNTTLDPVAELKALEARKVAQAEQFARETAEAKARIEALYALQHPIWRALQTHREKRQAIRRVEKMIALFQDDAAKKREMLHSETIVRDPLNMRGHILALHGEIHHLDVVQADCQRSIGKLKAGADNLRAEATAYANQNNLGSMLAAFDEPVED